MHYQDILSVSLHKNLFFSKESLRGITPKRPCFRDQGVTDILF